MITVYSLLIRVYSLLIIFYSLLIIVYSLLIIYYSFLILVDILYLLMYIFLHLIHGNRGLGVEECDYSAPASISVFYGPRPPTALPIVTVTV